ncbi:MAG: hypothetical protein KC445_09280 [Anaerolineales bacterium]|nr:hypothetical protein [Anaerolineales bacterium]
MKIILIIWLTASLLVSILVIAALMRSSQLSRREGLSESYDDWEQSETRPEVYSRRAESQ